MNSLPKGPQAARLRQRKFELVSRFLIPPHLLPGSVSLSHFRCGKPTCHCTHDAGHPAWSFTYMVNGKKRVQHIPKELVPEIQQRVAAGREYQDAVREVLAANAQLWVLAQKQKRRG
jgi:predicted ABC-type transport system involved in lysophospholipase L1 biosynthesis ATPase subunit